jgi:hypothetical protein
MSSPIGLESAAARLAPIGPPENRRSAPREVRKLGRGRCAPQKLHAAQIAANLSRGADATGGEVTAIPMHHVRSATRAQSHSRAALRIVLLNVCDLLRLASSAVRSRSELAAENLLLRKQLALYVERQVRPRRADDATRIALVVLSSLIDWRRLLSCDARHAHPIASQGVPVVLAMEVTASRPTAMAGRPAALDR